MRPFDDSHFAFNWRYWWEFGGGVSWIEVRLASEPDGRTRLELEHIAKVDEHWGQRRSSRSKSRSNWARHDRQTQRELWPTRPARTASP